MPTPQQIRDLLEPFVGEELSAWLLRYWTSQRQSPQTPRLPRPSANGATLGIDRRSCGVQHHPIHWLRRERPEIAHELLERRLFDLLMRGWP